MIDGVGIVRMASQNFFKILDCHIVVEVIKALECNLVLRVGRAKDSLIKGISTRAKPRQNQQEQSGGSQTRPGGKSIHYALV